MNDEQNIPSQKDIKDAKAAQAGKDVADLAGKAASTYFGGAVGSKLYDVASKTKAGQAILNTAGNSISKNPISRQMLSKTQPAVQKAKPLLNQMAGSAGAQSDKGQVPNSSSSNSFNSSQDQQTENSDNKDSSSSPSKNPIDVSKALKSTDKIKKLKRTWIAISTIAPIFLYIIIIVVVVAVMMSGFLYIKNTASETATKIGNLFSGCGWSTYEECNEKRENNFYETVDYKYKYYKTNYNVEINKDLIIATLTYNNPFLTSSPDDETDNFSSMLIDYKKSIRQVDNLIKNMLDEHKECSVRNKEKGTIQSVDCSLEFDYAKKEDYEFIIDISYTLNEEKYRDYLQGTNINGENILKHSFVIKYFLNNDYTDENKQKALDITEEIYQRVEFANYLNGNNSSSNNFSTNNTMVTVTNCSGNLTIEEVTLNDYLQGVIYMQIDNTNSKEYLNFVAMSAKNYLYSVNGASANSMPQNLRIRNCKQNQLYCSIKSGCHYIEGNGSDSDTLTSGADQDNLYIKSPLNNTSDYENIKKAVDETLHDFLIKDNQIVATKYVGDNKEEILNLLSNSNYKDVLINLYGGEISEVELSPIGYPLDLKNNYITSAYGWRFDPYLKNCRHHNGTDIDAESGDNIYAIADGVVITNQYSSSYGNYIVIGHGNYNSSTHTYEYYSLYAHQIKLSTLVSIGDRVSVGQQIGYVGSTGWSTGSHLHIEIYTLENGIRNRTDPVAYFKNIDLDGKVGGVLYNSEAACLLEHPR